MTPLMVNCTKNSLVITPSPTPHTEIQVISVKLHGERIMRYLYFCYDLTWILLIIWLCRQLVVLVVVILSGS